MWKTVRFEDGGDSSYLIESRDVLIFRDVDLELWKWKML